MTLRYLCGAARVAVITWGLTGSAYAQLRDGGIAPPEKSAFVTVAGCLLRGDLVRGGQRDKYVLANPQTGPVDSVPEGRCTAAAAANALELDNPRLSIVNDSMLGRVIEINGRLERETSKDPDNLRELEVRSARVVPVARPHIAAAPAPAPAPDPLTHVAPEPQPEP